jgi:PAS domain S-box-containing protein
LKTFLKLFDPAIQVEPISSPGEVQRLLKEGSYDCVVSDYQMPVMDGIELAKRIRITSKIPFIIYTGKGSEEVALEAFIAGVDNYVRKEFDPSHYQVLAKRVRTAVEKNKAEKDLRESIARIREREAEFYAIFMNTPFLFVLVDEEMRVRDLNKITADFLGRPADELGGLRAGEALRCLHSLDDPKGCGFGPFCEICKVRLTVLDTIETGEAHYQVEAQLPLMRDEINEEITLLMSTAHISTSEGHRVIVTFNDITQLKLMEEELRGSEERWRALINLAPDGIMTLDLKGFVTMINDAFVGLTGFSKDEIVGKHFTRLGTLRAREMPTYMRVFASLIRGKTPPPSDFEYRQKNGSVRWGEAHINLVKIDENKREVLMVLRDTTKRKRMEEEVRRHSERLEELVEEKTGELMDAERLVTAGKVASMVGHDLRGPLQIINNALYLLKNAPEKSDEAQEMAHKAIRRATEMLEELRSKTRDAPLNFVPTDVAALVKTTVEETRIPDSVNVALKAGEGLADASLDPLQMRRVLDNLIENAVDAMPDGGVLRVVVEKREDDVVVMVSDTGVGISEDEMSDLFKPFHSSKPGGLGLGLAYCRRAVEAHGGTIAVDSKIGEGTTFTIKIPLKLKKSSYLRTEF